MLSKIEIYVTSQDCLTPMLYNSIQLRWLHLGLETTLVIERIGIKKYPSLIYLLSISRERNPGFRY